MHVLRRRVTTLDEATPILESCRGLRYRQGIGDADERRLELVQPALVCHSEQTRIAHKWLAMDALDVLRWNSRPAQDFTILPLMGPRRLWLQRSTQGLQACLHQGRSTLGNRPCETMYTPATWCPGVL